MLTTTQTAAIQAAHAAGKGHTTVEGLGLVAIEYSRDDVGDSFDECIVATVLNGFTAHIVEVESFRSSSTADLPIQGV